jgi:L-alanine-DL-glutamate epimerase-like enolase superfamily enzyme
VRGGAPGVTIRRIRAFRQWQPFRDGAYACSGGSAEGTDSTIVAITDDDGVTGWGETATLGAFYDPAFAGGLRAGLTELAPHLVGGPCAPAAVLRRADRLLKGHPYVKAPLDMALWDLRGRRAGVPLCELLGGRHGDGVDLYNAISAAAPDAMAARARTFRQRGYWRLQVKLGDDPDRDAERLAAVRAEVGPGVPLFGDANGLYSTAQARRLLRAAAGVDFWLEQPCATYDECRAVRAHCPVPMVLDESIDSLPALLRAAHDRVADGVTLKLARIGGITRTALLRDAAVELGLHVTVEDTGGSDLDTAAVAHVSLSTPVERRLHTVDFNAWVTVANATGMPAPVDGRLTVPDGPGLGVDVLEEALGAPFLDVA